MYSLSAKHWSGSLLKGGLNIPQFPLGPRCHGRVGQKMSCKFFSISTYDYIFGIHAYITLMNWSQFCVTLCYSYYMRNRIRHNYPSLIQCLRAFHILCFAYLLFRCYCYNYYKTAIVTFATVTITIILLCYFATVDTKLSRCG